MRKNRISYHPSFPGLQRRFLGNPVFLTVVFAAAIILIVSCAADAHAPEASQISALAGQQGWLDPVTRRGLRIVNVLVVAILLGLSGAIFILWLRLRDKVSKLETVNRKLVEQGELLRLATEATPVGIWDFYPARNMGFFSDQWYLMFGYQPTPRPMPLSEWRKLVHPDDLAASEQAFFEYLKSGRGLYDAEMRIRRADGSWCWVLAKGKAITWNERGVPTRIIGFHLDIQKIKDAQEGLAQSEERFRTLFKMAPLPMINLRLDGTVVDINNSFIRTLGYTMEDVPTIERFRERACPDPDHGRKLKAAWDAAVNPARTGGTQLEPVEFRITCRDGAVRIMMISASLTGPGMIVSFFDITELRRAEEERTNLHDQLLQTKKLEAVGNLAGGVAHDFNNMMGVVIGYAELALHEMGPAEPIRENLDRILEAAQSSASLTRQLLAFARKQALAPEVFDVNESIESILKMLRRLIGENITLEWTPLKRPCTVMMDKLQLQQVLTNLCVNARDAIADVGAITIETGLIPSDDEFCRMNPWASPGDYVTISVSDDGCGMDADTIEHIFEPFFTTKGLNAGTGLGLATVYGIVRQNNGNINVRSEPGRGAVFTIHFPFFSASVAGKDAGRREDLPGGRGETILIIEDNPLLLKLGSKMLAELGYSVMRAATPAEALRLAREKGGAIDLFIADVIMPEMNGLDLAVQLKALIPGARHLFMSGYPADVIADHGVLAEGAVFLQKPFTLADLSAKIREVLD